MMSLRLCPNLASKCYTLAHVKLTHEEAVKYKDCPVIFNCERGFFFEPDENNEIKICNEFPGYTNLNENGESIPFYANEIPLEAAKDIRKYLKETMPELSEKPFVKTKICWITDSPDRELIITTHPDHGNLVIGSGDSGESFMIMPVIGKYIGKVVTEGNAGLSEEEQLAWRWRPETAAGRDDIGGRYGGSGHVTDLKSIKEWVSVENPEPHPLF
ncbi:unnamed protein product [Ambrosiozyma monospora]|uniref:Unnamed protein product n=1 Tax=Ambrosiozyma monospora TaxID=43982 RepID=A0ACB5T8E3_AMBMO|nr:unnamed protein product [Ambrosiozyma monospora]